MATLQVIDLPDELYERLQAAAMYRGTTVEATVLEAIERQVHRVEWRRRVNLMEPVDLGMNGAELVRDARRDP